MFILFTIILSFLTLIILESFSVKWMASHLGLGKTVFLIFATALLGAVIARNKAKNSLKNILKGLHNGNPGKEMFNALTFFIAAAFLIIPGFFTDIIGLWLLIPFVRNIIFWLFFKNAHITTEFSAKYHSSAFKKNYGFENDDIIDVKAESVESENNLLNE